MDGLDPRIARLKQRMLEAPYEICTARALHYTRAYQQTEGLDPALRNATALARTLDRQAIAIQPDEWLAGSKTERFLAGPLSVERGDFLRSLQLELDILHLKQRPFAASARDKRIFRERILPYWDGKTVRDRKAAEWQRRGIIDTAPGVRKGLKRIAGLLRFVRSLDRAALRKIAGANSRAPLSLSRLRTLYDLRFELARNNPTPAVFCFDVQGHLSLGVDKVVELGMGAIIEQARARRARVDPQQPRAEKQRAFLDAVVLSLEAACRYAERFAALAEQQAARASSSAERERLERIAVSCRRVPRHRPETFHQALQAAWFALLVGEIQYGTHEVFAVGRIDQYLYPFLEADLAAGRIDRELAVCLLQEFFLKQTANVEPIPELGMETNAVLGNSQHVAVIGGCDASGRDASNELTFLCLEAFARMQGSVNQLSVRISSQSPPDLLRRGVQALRSASGLAFYNDEVIVPALQADGLSLPDARDYCVVGCIETSGQSDTHGCPGGHELVLPAVLMLALSRGRRPVALPGQQPGLDCGDPDGFGDFEALLAAFRRQLAHQVDVLIRATESKDRAYRDFLPAPYVSALMDDCIERARDITEGGARYDFTSLDVRGLATLADSLLAIERFVYDRAELDLAALIRILERDFEGCEDLRQRILGRAPKYGTGDARADGLALRVVGWIHELLEGRHNLRGGRWRACYYSYGNHVIDGLMLGATPDGRRRGEPISNGISPSNLLELRCGPQGPLRSAASIPAEQASSGVALNMRFHPGMLRSEGGLETFARMIRTYFALGGMHLQPNVVSTETLRLAQQQPEEYRDLVVKVSGYSAYFCDLGKSIQEDIIARWEFGA
ncbi:MAG: hypothetical protein JXR96_21895 [Deltaproteobacteria bacterium]|nr:hypothetical protein [Deltaproteobacteria bacterium]